MLLRSRKRTNLVLFLIAAVSFTPASQLRAEAHLVSPADMHQSLVDSAKARQSNLAKVQRFFSSEVVQKTLASAQTDLKKVERALPELSDEELARLASQTDKIETDIAAGALNNQEITYILIALATAVVILVIVAA